MQIYWLHLHQIGISSKALKSQVCSSSRRGQIPPLKQILLLIIFAALKMAHVSIYVLYTTGIMVHLYWAVAIGVAAA